VLDVADLPAGAQTEIERFLADGMATAPSVELARFVRKTIETGPRYVLLRSLPGGFAERERARSVLRWLLHGLGRVLPQNVAGDDLYEVVDRSDPRGYYGGSRGTGALRDHTDQAAAPSEGLADVLALWCVEPASSGGESLISSGHAMHDMVLESDPSLIGALYEPYPFARPADGTSAAPPVWAPVFTSTPDGVIVRYNHYFVSLGTDATAAVLPDRQLAALNLAEEIAAGPSLRRSITLAAGDVLLVDNRVVMHNRTAYDDRPEDEFRRRLLRGWVQLASA
jgi:hypothetical protein